MKKIISTVLTLVFAFPFVHAQSYFYDDFESYTVNDYLGNSSSVWTTWNNAPGTAEDAWVSDVDYASGKQSIYFESAKGNGPVDLVLPFGGVHTTGRFKFTSKWMIPSKSGGAYFNFQGDASVGSTWAIEVYLYDDGSIQAGKYLSGSYPQDQWFEMVVDIDLTNNKWEMFIDGVSLGSWTNPINRVSYLDVFTIFSNSGWWMDDVSFCVDNACASDIAMDKVTVSPNPVCTNHPADVTVSFTNNGPEPSKGFTLGLAMSGQPTITKKLAYSPLAVGRDTTITIPGMLLAKAAGTGLSISAINVLGDKDASNDVANTTLDVLPSPSGFDIGKGSVFQGKYNTNGSPDLVESGKTNSYDLIPGKGFSNGNFGSAWAMPTVVARTARGVLVPSTAYTVTYPSSGVSGKISFTGSQTYMDSVITFSITVKNLPNGCDSVVTHTLRVVPTPNPNFKLPSSICYGDDIEFRNTSTIHSGNMTFKWSFGDGDTSDLDNPFHQFKAAGTYTIKLVATSYPYLITRDTSFTIQVSEIPDVKFRANNKCDGVAVNFQNQSVVSNGVLSFDWDFGDGSAHNATKDPSHLYTSSGGYKVTLKAEANGCAATLTKNAYVFARPVAAFTAPSTPVCSKSNVILTNNSTLASGKLGALWNFGDGTVSTVKEGAHAYQSAGTYMVKLMSVSEFECKDSITKPVTIKPSPLPDFAGNQFCGKIPTTFTNKTVEDLPSPVYTWTFSDNFTSTLKNVTRTWPYEGPFSATLKADYSNGCTGTTTKDFTVSIQPKADFSVGDICSGETAKFVNKSQGDKAGMQFNWDFGNSVHSTTMAPVNLYNPAKTTTYVVTLVVSYPAACADTIRRNITVSEAPVCDFNYKVHGFMNTEFTPSNKTYSKYEWFFGEGGTAVGTSPTYQYLYSGNFNVTMKATNAAGCMCEVTKKVAAMTGVNTVNTNAGVSIYPNPNNGTFTVRHESGQNMKVEVFSVLGSKIYSNTSEDGNLSVNMEDQAKGIYLVKVTVNGVTSTSKITVN